MSQNTPVVVSRELYPIIGMSIITTLKAAFDEHTVKDMEDALGQRVGEIQNRIGESKLLIQIYPKDTPFNTEVPYTVIIGYPVESLNTIPAGMMAHIIPAGDYAKVTHVGLESELSHTYDFLYGSWLPESGNKSSAYDFEVWDERYQPEQATNEIDVYVALAPQPVLT